MGPDLSTGAEDSVEDAGPGGGSQPSDRRMAAGGGVGHVATATSLPRVRSPSTTLGGIALLGVGLLAAARIAVNLPGSVVGADLQRWYPLLHTAATVGPAAAAIGLGVVADSAWRRVGLVAVGVFGLLATVSPGAALPATGVVVLGGWLGALPPTIDGARTAVSGRGIVATALLAGLSCSLVGSAGVAPPLLRPVGSVLSLAGVAVSPLSLSTRPRTLDWTVGAIVAAGTLFAGTASPFVSGAVMLVVGGIVHVPFVLVVAAVGGAGITVSAALARGDGAGVTAGALLVVAGVPYTLPRALGVVVAATIVVRPVATRSESA